MNAEQEIKPCPFCGHVGLDFNEEGSTYRWAYADCSGCGASTGEVRKHDGWRQDAIDAWNTRAALAASPVVQTEPVGEGLFTPDGKCVGTSHNLNYLQPHPADAKLGYHIRPLYTSPLPQVDALDGALIDGYESSSCIGDSKSGRISMHYKSVDQAMRVHDILSGRIDAAMKKGSN